jgi:hypothetical protein
MSPAHNTARYEALETQYQTDCAVHDAKQSLAADTDHEARRLFGQYLDITPVDIAAGTPLATICEQLRQLMEAKNRPMGDLRPAEAAKHYQLRDALAAAERARVARERADALRADARAHSDELAPLHRLVRACREYTGRDGVQRIGASA